MMLFYASLAMPHYSLTLWQRGRPLCLMQYLAQFQYLTAQSYACSMFIPQFVSSATD